MWKEEKRALQTEFNQLQVGKEAYSPGAKGPLQSSAQRPRRGAGIFDASHPSGWHQLYAILLKPCLGSCNNRRSHSWTGSMCRALGTALLTSPGSLSLMGQAHCPASFLNPTLPPQLIHTRKIGRGLFLREGQGDDRERTGQGHWYQQCRDSWLGGDWKHVCWKVIKIFVILCTL